MSIIDVQPVNANKLSERSVRVVPVYLVVSEDPSNKSGITKFLSVKLDEMQHAVRIVGFEINKEVKDICANYQEVLNSTDKKIYKELMLPWQRIVRIENLIFKSK